jgi:hypothetical protein
MPTRGNVSGATDRSRIDAAVAAADTPRLPDAGTTGPEEAGATTVFDAVSLGEAARPNSGPAGARPGAVRAGRAGEIA